jgi:CheY-like chemotaxis protein
VQLSVADTGTGMSKAALTHAGEPFFTTKEVGKGTGLGLPMVKGFAEQSGGAFAIDSELGRGTVASIWLPAAEAGAVVTHDPLVSTRAAAQILLVDDDRQVRASVTRQLEDLGHKVLAASGGTDALAILRAREAIDLMITDLAMPDMNGLALIQEAREARPRLPAILLTGHSHEATAMTRDTQASPDFMLIRKPATTAELKASISELLGSA